MTVLILAEPRSGSTSLAKWFTLHKFGVLYEPFNPLSSIYIPELLDSRFFENTKNKKIVVKELFWPNNLIGQDNVDYKELLSKFDFAIFLHRGNYKDQELSFCYGNEFNSLQQSYVLPKNYRGRHLDRLVFKELKEQFKIFREENRSRTVVDISYEELYELGKIDVIEDMLDFSFRYEFPVGERLRRF